MKPLAAIIAFCLGCLCVGCGGYAPSDVDDFVIVCPSCSESFNRKETIIRCRADSVLATCCRTECRHCGRTLAEPGDEVFMTMLSGGVHITKRGNSE